MSERRIVLRTDDDSTIEVRWEPGAKFVIEVNEQKLEAPADGVPEPAVIPPPPTDNTVFAQEAK